MAFTEVQPAVNQAKDAPYHRDTKYSVALGVAGAVGWSGRVASYQ